MLKPSLINVLWPFLRKNYLGKGEDDMLGKMALKKDDVVLEVGACTGALTLILARKVGVNGKVIAIEPNPYSFHILSKATEHLENVTRINAALGEKEGNEPMVITRPFDSGGHVGKVMLPSEQPISVRVTTVDSLFAVLKVKHFDYVILDCEGAELDVLKGARQTMKKRKIKSFIIEIHGAHLRQPLENLLSTVDYGCEYFDVEVDEYPLMHASLMHRR